MRLRPQLLRRAYDRLYAAHGPQGWWPTTPPGESHPRYYPGRYRRPLSEAEQWEIMVGAVLTQNTAWRNAELALSRLIGEGLMDPAAMYALEVEQLADLIRSSGYYRQKARRLQRLASYLVERYKGKPAVFLSQPALALRRELLALSGIGPETADSILLYAARYPFFVVDAYTRRFGGRLGLFYPDLSYAKVQSIFMEHLPRDPDLFNEYHALLVRHGIVRCRARPHCGACELKELCKYGRRSQLMTEEKS